MAIANPLTYQPRASRRSGVSRWVPVLRLGRWLATGALLAGVASLPLVHEVLGRRQIRKETERTLAAAKRVMAAAAPTPVPPPPGVRAPWGTGVLVPSLMSDAQGPGGVILSIRDGSWILIRYQSSAHPKVALAVAVDSGGQWFVSDQHSAFPERFVDYRHVRHLWWRHREAVLAGQAPPQTTGLQREHMLRGINPQLSEIEGSATLAEARLKLQELGFRNTPP